MKKTVHICTTCIVLSFFIFNTSEAYTFTRTLSVGSTGQDVYELQKLLNGNSQTQIILEGVGSPGQETYYFGELTKQAVIKFQNLNAQTILLPLGLTQGTGFVGKGTIAFLNQNQQVTLIENITEEPASPIIEPTQSIVPPTTNTISTSTQQFVFMPPKPRAGDDLYIGSQNKISETTFLLDGKPLLSDCTTEYTCQIAIPRNISEGSHTLSSNNAALGSTTISIVSNNSQKPNASIKSLSFSKDNLITGKDFSPTMNIYTSHGQFTTQTLNNSFILNFPQDRIYTEGLGIFVMENSNGLQSDTLLIQYEK